MSGKDRVSSRGPERVRVVADALAILECLGDGEAHGVTELARRISRPVSSTHRLLSTLVGAGFAERDPETRRYWRGPALYRVRPPDVSPPILRDLARPVLLRLAEAAQLTAHLAIPSGSEVIAIDHVLPDHGAPADHVVGARLPGHATALGLVLAAFRWELAQALRSERLRPMTEATVVDRAQLEGRLSEIRQRGYAINLRGWRRGTAGVAAPVRTSSRDVVAAVGVSGSADVVSRRSVQLELARLVVRAGLEIGARLDRFRPVHPDDERMGPSVRADATIVGRDPSVESAASWAEETDGQDPTPLGL